MRNGLSNSELEFYDEIARSVTDTLDYLDRERGAIPPEVADGIWAAVDPSNYGHIREATIFIERLFDEITYRLRNAFNGSNGYTREQIYQIVGQWVEDKAARTIRQNGWMLDNRTGEWFQQRNSFVANRGVGSRISGRRNNQGVGVPRGQMMAGRGPSLMSGGPVDRNPRGTMGGDWAAAMAADTGNAPERPQRPQESYRDAPRVDRTEQPTRRPQRAPINQNAAVETVRKANARKPVEFTYKPAERDVVESYNTEAGNHALKVLDVISAHNESEGAEIKVFDLQFLLPTDNKTVVTFAQTFLANESSYLARILYNDAKAFRIPEKSYNFARDKFKESLEDIKDSDKPGVVIDSVIFDNMTRNEGKKIEKLIVDEINKRISITLFNRLDKTGQIPEISSVAAIDELLNYKPYLEALGENAGRWKAVVGYIVTNVLQNLFTNAHRIKRDTNQFPTLIVAESNNKFIFDGLDMQNAINGGNEEKKNRYLDEYFKNFIVLEMSGIVFYTDIFEDATRVNAVIAQGSTTDIFEDALMAAFGATNQATGNDGFTLKRAASHGEVTLFAKRPEQIDAFNVKFPFIPTPNKQLERNARLDMGYVNDTTGTVDGPTVTEDDFDQQFSVD